MRTKEIDVLSPIEADDSFKYWNDELYSRVCRPLALFDQMIRKSNPFASPRLYRSPGIGSATTQYISDVVAGLLDNRMAVYEIGQVSVAMEKAVCSYLSKFIGWDENRSNGFFYIPEVRLQNLTAFINCKAAFFKWKIGIMVMRIYIMQSWFPVRRIIA